MRSFAISACLILMVACAKPDQQAAKDSTAGSLGAGAPGQALTLDAVAGNWDVDAMLANSDSVILRFQMVASSDPNGWSMSFPSHAPIPLRVVAVDGDSIVVEGGPYESMLRKGVQVSTHGVMRLENGELVGNTVAHYATTGPDSVVMVRTHGKRGS